MQFGTFVSSLLQGRDTSPKGLSLAFERKIDLDIRPFSKVFILRKDPKEQDGKSAENETENKGSKAIVHSGLSPAGCSQELCRMHPRGAALIPHFPPHQGWVALRINALACLGCRTEYLPGAFPLVLAATSEKSKPESEKVPPQLKQVLSGDTWSSRGPQKRLGAHRHGIIILPMQQSSYQEGLSMYSLEMSTASHHLLNEV